MVKCRVYPSRSRPGAESAHRSNGTWKPKYPARLPRAWASSGLSVLRRFIRKGNGHNPPRLAPPHRQPSFGFRGQTVKFPIKKRLTGCRIGFVPTTGVPVALIGIAKPHQICDPVDQDRGLSAAGPPARMSSGPWYEKRPFSAFDSCGQTLFPTPVCEEAKPPFFAVLSFFLSTANKKLWFYCTRFIGKKQRRNRGLLCFGVRMSAGSKKAPSQHTRCFLSLYMFRFPFRLRQPGCPPLRHGGAMDQSGTSAPTTWPQWSRK